MKHELVWHANAWEDYLYWLETDKKHLKKINELIKAIDREPFTGIGKPEPLLHSLKGCWSRRIDREHRLVYSVTAKQLTILACRHHY
jgi:toxin YoeB